MIKWKGGLGRKKILVYRTGWEKIRVVGNDMAKMKKCRSASDTQFPSSAMVNFSQ